MKINRNTTKSAKPIIDIVIGNDHFTDENIRKWATGDLTDIDFATGEESLIIEYLSLIIAERKKCLVRAVSLLIMMFNAIYKRRRRRQNENRMK